jgi:hypothetical protein
MQKIPQKVEQKIGLTPQFNAKNPTMFKARGCFSLSLFRLKETKTPHEQIGFTITEGMNRNFY